MKMNGKNRFMKASKKKGAIKTNKLHGKSRKNTFIQKKRNHFNKSNGISNQYEPETGDVPPVEVQFAKRLAANEPIIRDKAIKKLKKWLISRSSLSYSDSEDSKPMFNESEMLRLWKGLHYCFWMSDKPLVQEELAEKISSMIHCFKVHNDSALLYMKCFLVTLGREWVGIDKHRMDKFMMLTRRMVRQCFVYVGNENWDSTLIQKFSSLFELNVLGANRINGTSMSALGFQLHFADVYLEELAKASEISKTKSEKSILSNDAIQGFLMPFVNELACGQEERLLSHIEIRIFDHLVRQSDVATEYEQDEDDGVEAEIEQEQEDLVESSKTLDDDGDGDFSIEDADPRAGKGDVTLPQISVDYKNISKILLEAGSKKEVLKPQRERLYRITKKFNHVATGIYPFALEMTDDGERLMEEREFEELERNLRMEEKKISKGKIPGDCDNANKVREERKQYRVALKKKMKMEKERQDHIMSQPVESDKEKKDNSLEAKATKKQIEKQNSKKKSIDNSKRKIRNGQVKVDKDKDNTPSEENQENALDKENVDNEVSSSNMEVACSLEITNQDCAENFTSPIAPLEKLSSSNVEVNKKTKKKHKNKAKKNSLCPNTDNDALVTSETKEKDQGDVDAEINNPLPNNLKRKKDPNTKEVDAKKLKHSTNSCTADLNTAEEIKIRKKKKKKKVKSEDRKVTEDEAQRSKPTEEMNGEDIKDKMKGDASTEGVFSVNSDWDEPLKEGETEIFVPSRKHNSKNIPPVVESEKKKKKKKDRNKEKTASDEVYGNPSITTPDKPPTPVFVKKAISKSGATNQVPAKHTGKNIHSEPKRLGNSVSKISTKDKRNGVSKRINFAMSENKCQSLLELDKSIQQSPHFQPYDASKRPAKGPILKTPPSGNKNSKNLTPFAKQKKKAVLYNTMINGKSKFATRAVASDFF